VAVAAENAQEHTMPVAHSYKLGKDQQFSFGTGGSLIANKDVKSVTFTRETAAEAEVTTRGSETIQEFVPVRWNTSFEVVVLDHACAIHSQGVVSIAGATGAAATGLYYVNNIGEPQEIDGAIETTISLRRHAGAQVV
jgi:hypothetical protein